MVARARPRAAATGRTRRRPRRRPGRLGLLHLAQPAGLDLVDEAANAVLVSDERARVDARERVAQPVVEVVEALGAPLGPDAGLLLDPRAQLGVVEPEHPAVGVAH